MTIYPQAIFYLLQGAYNRGVLGLRVWGLYSQFYEGELRQILSLLLLASTCQEYNPYMTLIWVLS